MVAPSVYLPGLGPSLTIPAWIFQPGVDPPRHPQHLISRERRDVVDFLFGGWPLTAESSKSNAELKYIGN